jgi:hypothetical protein
MPESGVISAENESGGFPMVGRQTPLPEHFYAADCILANQKNGQLGNPLEGSKLIRALLLLEH